jgi:ectoine hydroxylase-related dioxygenase (phytanoyl-CoA dioxygenase family)
MLGLKNLLKFRSSRVKQWKNIPSELPWFDHPNALVLLEQRRKAESLSDSEFEALRNWVEYGYVVLRDVVQVEDVDGMMADLDNVWTTTTPIPNLKIDDLRINPGDPPGVDHSKLVQLDTPTKERHRREARWRIHQFVSHSESARRIFQSAALARWSHLILGRKADPSYTINFTFGSEQGLHQDTAVFAVSPMNHLIGAWLACEDIDPDSGPLVYYPGSHREKLFTQFDNYPQTILKTCKPALIDEYLRFLADVALRYERKTFIARKGEWFLWHGMMIHGGDAIRNPSLTRRSYVCHYIPPGMNKEMEIQGPFNW